MGGSLSGTGPGKGNVILGILLARPCEEAGGALWGGVPDIIDLLLLTRVCGVAGVASRLHLHPVV